MKVNRKVEYALMALKYIVSKEDGELTSARELCEQFNIPFDTTSKVLQIMNSKEILTSVKGTKGGYVLAKSLDQITYMELVEYIEEKDMNSICSSQHKNCSLKRNCNIVSPMEQLKNKITNFLSQLTLDELLLGESFNVHNSRVL